MSQLFFAPKIVNGFAQLEEEESRHLLTVLRRKQGDRLQLTDGQGFLYEAEIVEAGKRHAMVKVLSSTPDAYPDCRWLHIAMAPTKQIERFEWFLEKATEIGVGQITPLRCKRSERDTVRIDRLEKVVLSATKQSLRGHLPQLHELSPFSKVIKQTTAAQKYIAWCADTPGPHLKTLLQPGIEALVLIGPEGDFSPDEVQLALDHGFVAVSLGAARLRTETAGVMVSSIGSLAQS